MTPNNLFVFYRFTSRGRLAELKNPGENCRIGLFSAATFELGKIVGWLCGNGNLLRDWSSSGRNQVFRGSRVLQPLNGLPKGKQIVTKHKCGRGFSLK